MSLIFFLNKKQKKNQKNQQIMYYFIHVSANY